MVSGNGIRFSSAEGRWVLAVALLGLALVFLDSTVVNVALPSIGRDLDAGVSELEWVVDGYLLALAALILLGGGLGDRYGRRRVFVAGVLHSIRSRDHRSGGQSHHPGRRGLPRAGQHPRAHATAAGHAQAGGVTEVLGGDLEVAGHAAAADRIVAAVATPDSFGELVLVDDDRRTPSPPSARPSPPREWCTRRGASRSKDATDTPCTAGLQSRGRWTVPGDPADPRRSICHLRCSPLR